MTRLAREVFSATYRSREPGGYFTKQIIDPDEFTQSTGLYACNPSIHFDGTTWRCNVRAINYKLGEKPPEIAETKNYMLTLDDYLDVEKSQLVVDLSTRPRNNYPVRGYEDCRLFSWRGTRWMSATICDALEFDPANNTGASNIEMCLLMLDENDNITETYPMRGPWSKHPQKNWIPVVREGDLKFIYSVKNMHLIGMYPDDLRGQQIVREYSSGPIRDWTHDPEELRGSSQAVRVTTGPQKGSWLYLVHDRTYASRFVLADDVLRVKGITEAFYFVKPGIEFCAGLAVDGERLVASYSVRDATVELGIFNLTDVIQRMVGL